MKDKGGGERKSEGRRGKEGEVRRDSKGLRGVEEVAEENKDNRRKETELRLKETRWDAKEERR